MGELLFWTKFQIRQVLDWHWPDDRSLRAVLVAEAYADWQAREPDKAQGFADSHVAEVDVNVVDGTFAVYLYSEE